MFKWRGQRLEKRKQKARQLWEREFDIVNEGLDEKQVIAFVDNLIVQHKASQQASAASLSSLIRKAVTDAEQIAASIKMRAQIEAEDEAATIISRAKQEADEIKRRAEIETQKEAEEILSASNRKAEITEVETRQKALLFLLRAREEIEKEVRGEYKSAHSQLSASLQALMSEGQNIAAELKDKRERLWESKRVELKEYEATLLSASGVAIAPPETLVPTETEIEPDVASKEKMREPVQLQEEAPVEGIEQLVQLQAEKIEQPAQLQEEAKRKTEETRKAKEARKQAEKDAKLAVKERALEEKVEVPVQVEKEATVFEPVEEKVEVPVQVEKEATVFELVEEAMEETLGQRPPEERPGKEEKLTTGETEFAQLKLDSQALYTGEVELDIPVPVELKLVSKLYNYLQTIPELKILHTRGSWDRGTTITVVLDKAMPLISLISKIPDVEVTAELPQKDSLVKGRSSSLLRGGKGVKGIKLILKEAQPP